MCDDTKFILTVTVVAPPSRPADQRVTQALQTFWEHSVFPIRALCRYTFTEEQVRKLFLLDALDLHT